MHYFELVNGDLRITADQDDRADLAYAYGEGGYPRAEATVIDRIVGNGLDSVAPEHIGALTDAPIFADGFSFNDAGEPLLEADAKVWWFPNYMVRDPWAQLRDTGRVDFTLSRAA